MKITHPKFIVVIGASAGGLDALGEMVQTFEKGLDCAYCIVLHLSRKEMSLANFRREHCLHSPKVMVKRYRRCFSDIARPSMKEKTKENSF